MTDVAIKQHIIERNLMHIKDLETKEFLKILDMVANSSNEKTKTQIEIRHLSDILNLRIPIRKFEPFSEESLMKLGTHPFIIQVYLKMFNELEKLENELQNISAPQI